MSRWRRRSTRPLQAGAAARAPRPVDGARPTAQRMTKFGMRLKMDRRNRALMEDGSQVVYDPMVSRMRADANMPCVVLTTMARQASHRAKGTTTLAQHIGARWQNRTKSNEKGHLLNNNASRLAGTRLPGLRFGSPVSGKFCASRAVSSSSGRYTPIARFRHRTSRILAG